MFLREDEKERLKTEVRILREIRAIVERKYESGHDPLLEAEEDQIRNKYPRYARYLNYDPDSLESHIERLECDLQMVENGDLFTDVVYEEE